MKNAKTPLAGGALTSNARVDQAIYGLSHARQGALLEIIEDAPHGLCLNRAGYSQLAQAGFTRREAQRAIDDLVLAGAVSLSVWAGRVYVEVAI